MKVKPTGFVDGAYLGCEGKSPGCLQGFGPEQLEGWVPLTQCEQVWCGGEAPGSTSGHVGCGMLSSHPGRDGEEAGGSRAQVIRGSAGWDRS